MTTTSSFLSTIALPLASLLRSSVVLIAASLGCVPDDASSLTAAAAPGGHPGHSRVFGFRKPGDGGFAPLSGLSGGYVADAWLVTCADGRRALAALPC